MNKNLVFLHGFLGHPQEFDFFKIVEKSEESFDCISINLNQNTSFNLKAQADFLKNKLTQLNISKAHFWGYSMGGRVLLEFYKNYPEMCETLTLESVSLGLADPQQKDERVKADAAWAELIVKDPDQFLRKWYGQALFDHFRTNPDFPLYESLRRKSLSSLHSQMIVEASPGANSDHYEVLRNMGVPTLALVGQFDQKYQEIWGKLIDKPGKVAIEIIKNSGHVIHLENPQEALRVFQRFIRRFS